MKSPGSRKKAASDELTIEAANPSSEWILLLTDIAQRAAANHHRPRRLGATPEGPQTALVRPKRFLRAQLAEPNIWDKGKDKPETEKLRMPNLHLTKEQVRALTTFLLAARKILFRNYQYRQWIIAATFKKAGGSSRNITVWAATNSFRAEDFSHGYGPL